MVVIVGGGIGGLTLALSLHRRGVPCRIVEAAPEYRALGVGINLLAHAMRQLADVGLADRLVGLAVEPQEWSFFNRHGQLIYREPTGKFATPGALHLSVHRGDLQMVLVDAVMERLGKEAIGLGRRCVRVEQNDGEVIVHLVDSRTGDPLPAERGTVAIACDGIHSAVRKQFYLAGDPLVYAGTTMWRGVTRGRPFLNGASIARIGTYDSGKLLIYAIRNYADGTQLLNWVAEARAKADAEGNWSKEGKLEDFIGYFKDWHFDWLDVPDMMARAEAVLEYPMADRDPLDRWTFGRVTLLGDAAHPMVPRGGNGAAQSIIDARVLADLLADAEDPVAALQAYEAQRRPATNKVVLTNRVGPPDTIISLVEERTQGRPFTDLDSVISQDELRAISQQYASVTENASIPRN
jgi:2-polyprenyl-6-methoxyphenol hydroxylase-like FAD-dependent oxidoreductase